MIKTQILQQQTRRILAHSNRSCFIRSFETLSDANRTPPSRVEKDLDQKEHWWKQGHQVKPSDLRCSIKNLCDSNQFSKAVLEASKWMGEQKVFDIFPEDYAARLHLVENVLGLEEAEKFFRSIPENMRDYSVYATLLSSYTRSEKELDKSEATFEKMRELGFLLKPSPFNSMISLYGQLQNRDMVEKLVREMQENKVEMDSPTLNNALRVYADQSKIKEMEAFKTWVDEQGTKLEGETIVAMAMAYTRSGSIEKAIEMYGDVAGSQRKVHILWNECKKEAKDDGYRTVISSLLKLDDAQGAEKIYVEWKPEGPKLDMRIPGLLISRYYAEGNELKVEELVKLIRKKRYGMHLKKLRYCAKGIELKFEEMVKSIREKRYGGMHLNYSFSNFGFRKISWLPDLGTVKEWLMIVGYIIGIVGMVILLAVGASLELVWHEWLTQQHPPTSYLEVKLLNEDPVLYYFLCVRK